MNLLNTSWLTVRRQDGSLSILGVKDVADPDAVDIIARRPDFRGAIYQFLIGLLQTAYAPEDEDEWRELWEHPPSEADLEKAFAPWEHAFALDGDGPRFMQDVDNLINDPNRGEVKQIASLLIDAPGEKTVRDNLDFFTKRSAVEAICPACAAVALYALQANAPSGGVGHRVSMRGGGPLTSLLVPVNDDGSRHISLWQRLWINVLPADCLAQPGGSFHGDALKDILPWLVATRSSEKKDGQTTPDHAHGLQAYWGTPRRLRLDWEATQEGLCDLCGAESSSLLTQFRTKNYGVNYLGWQHPLTPYYHDPKKKELPLSVKGQKGGIGYKHWLGLTLGSPDLQPEAAKVLRHFMQQRWDRLGAGYSTLVWAFGYDMDNMKARCWYDATLPVHRIPARLRMEFALVVGELLEVAQEASRLLPRHVKAAWCDRPADLKDEPAIAQSFWHATEPLFYRTIAALAGEGALEPLPRTQMQQAWLKAVSASCLNLFDDWVTGEYLKDWDIERTVRARTDLWHWLNSAKPMKALWKNVNQQLKEVA